MTTSEYISIASLAFAMAAFVYSYLTNTKKYELANQQRTAILSWYSDTVNILIRLMSEAKEGFKNDILKKELLARLSANIEVGRFYFPNVIKEPMINMGEPEAYKGYRNITLDFLVYYYRLFDEQDATKYIGHAQLLERLFTSQLFKILDPRTYLRETKKHTGKTFSQELSFENFLESKPEAIEFYA